MGQIPRKVCLGVAKILKCKYTEFEIAQSIKCLQGKHEDLNSVHMTSVEKVRYGGRPMLINPVQGIPGVLAGR